MANKIVAIIQDQKELELPENCIPGYVAMLYIDRKLYDSMYCSSRETAKEMINEMVKDYKISLAWNSID